MRSCAASSPACRGRGPAGGTQKRPHPPTPSPHGERGADALVRVPTHHHAAPGPRVGNEGTGRELNRMQERGRRAQTDSPPRRQGRQETVARMKCLVPRLEPPQEAWETNLTPSPSPWERGADAQLRVPTHHHAAARPRAGNEGTGRELNRMQERGRRAQTDSPPRRQGRQETVARMKCLGPRLERPQEAWGNKPHPPAPSPHGERGRRTRSCASLRSSASSRWQRRNGWG